jgi:6-phosphogluconolactonase (cycloisomerase 2 family)
MKSGLFALAVGTFLLLTGCGGGRTGAGTSSSSNSNVLAYVLNQGDNSSASQGASNTSCPAGLVNGSISIFNLNSNTGSLSATGLTLASTEKVPSEISVTPNKQFAYVANFCSNSISAYRINSNGGLSSIGTSIPTGIAPASIAIDPTGGYVYTANSGDATISGFKIDNTNGSLTPIASSPISLSGLTPLQISSSPTTNIMYVSTTGGNSSDNTIITFGVNASDGSLTPLGSGGVATPPQPSSFVVDPSGKAAIATNQSSGMLSTFSVSSGSLSAGSSITTSSAPTWVTVTPNSKYAYVVDQGSNSLSSFTLDVSSASLTANGSSVTTGNYPQFVTVDPTGHFVYTVNNSGNTLSAFAIGSSGTLTPVSGSPFNVGSAPIAMVFVSF